MKGVRQLVSFVYMVYYAVKPDQFINDTLCLSRQMRYRFK